MKSEEVLNQDLFDFEDDESSRKNINLQFLKDSYDYETRFFIWGKSLAIQSPTWRMRDGQEIETYLDEFRRNPANATRDFGANPIDAVNPAIENKDFIDYAFEKFKNVKHPILKPPRIQPTGEITETNKSIVDDPAAVNKDPEGGSWFFKIKIKNKSELEGLMSKVDYDKFAKENPN